MKAKIILIGIMLFLTYPIFGQEEQWEPRKNITGYLSTQAEYIDGLELFEQNYGVSLAEAGILFSYQPLQKLTFKSVFSYRPGLTFDQMLNEASAEWAFSDKFKIKTGRFLSPLSKVNTYFYAPVNLGITLPMLVTHHEMYPLNIDGISLNGSFGDDFKLNYNFCAGAYLAMGLLTTGPIKYFGQEDIYLEATENDTVVDLDIQEPLDLDLYAASCGHIDLSKNDVFQIGVSSFYGETEEYKDPFREDTTRTDYDIEEKATKLSIGINAKYKFKTFQISGEHWFGNVKSDEGTDHISGGFYEASNEFGMFTLYLRYEIHNIYDMSFNRTTAGLNFKPNFTTTFKLEYFRDAFEIANLNGVLCSIVLSF